MTEQTLQSRIKNEFEQQGWYAAHLSPPNHPGFPDLLLAKDGYVLLVEIKDFSKIGPKEKFSALFQEAQMPFYLKMIKHGCPVLIIGNLGDNVLRITMALQDMVTDSFLLGRDSYLSQYAENYY